MSEIDLDDLESDIEAHRQELIEPAAKLYALQKIYGDQARKQIKQAYGRLIDAHFLTTGVLASALLRISGKFIPITDRYEERNSLFASFVIGLKTCEDTIEEGRYLQASTLLRQELETLAQLKIVRTGVRKKNRAPNISVLEKSLATLNGDLSAAAHLSQPHIVRAATMLDLSGTELPGPTIATRYFPAFDDGLAHRFFGLHLMLILGVIEELNIDLQEHHSDHKFTERESKAVNLAVKLMLNEGVIKMGD